MINSAKKAALSVTTICLLASNLISQAPDRKNVIDGAERAFEKAAKAVAMPAPGCAAGVSLNGENVFEKAFGLAEMEHSVPNTPKTIFESGSVAKQFTAAALVLLQQDGKLKIDDDARKYIPELPEYGKPITIRHLLNHTAGLRDWGSVMQLTGAGRGDRVISQELAHALSPVKNILISYRARNIPIRTAVTSLRRSSWSAFQAKRSANLPANAYSNRSR